MFHLGRAQPDDPRTMSVPVPADHQQDHGEILLQADSAGDLCLFTMAFHNKPEFLPISHQ